MKINIKATNLELTSAIKNYIEKKIGSLEKFLKKIEAQSEIEAYVEISKITRHHHKGEVFYAELNLNLPHKLLRLEEKSTNLYSAIDILKDKARAQISKIKSKTNLRKLK